MAKPINEEVVSSPPAHETPGELHTARRALLRNGLIGGAGLVAARLFAPLAGLAQSTDPASTEYGANGPAPTGHGAMDHDSGMATVGTVDAERNGFDPKAILTDWDVGRVSRTADGHTLREYDLVAVDREIEIAPGLFFPAWTYNGRVPGPTIRATEGDRVRIRFRNAGSHAHTIHFHGIHSAYMDGVAGLGRGVVNPGESFTYEFDAAPFGCHLYHCHAVTLTR